MAQLGTVAAIAGIAAAGISIAGTLYGGQKDKEAAYALAKQEEARGDAEFASSQRDAQERELEAKLILSRQQATAAASGAGAGNDAPTIVQILQKTYERAAYGTSSVLYTGKQARQAYYDSAAARRRSGDATALGSYFRAAGTLAGGIGRFAENIQ